MRMRALIAMMAGFFVMGFCDIIGTVMSQVKAECRLPDAAAGFLPSMAFVWFLLISIPTGILCSKVGRKNTVLVALAVTFVAMLLPQVAGAENWWLYAVAFALIGIGNTVMQAALPALMSNVVSPAKLTARISLGQFIRAVSVALMPVFVYVTATALDNWKLIFALYAIFTGIAFFWIRMTGMPDERDDFSDRRPRPMTFASCLTMLQHPYVLAMAVGIIFSVGADVGFMMTVPECMKNVYQMDLNKAGMGPAVYFAAKAIAVLVGAIVFIRISAARCFPWCMGVGVLATAAMFFAPNAGVFLVCVFVAALMTANGFGMCMGLAIAKVPQKANEITALMVMAIAGGAIVSPAIGAAQSAFGTNGMLGALILCTGCLLALGIFAWAVERKSED